VKAKVIARAIPVAIVLSVLLMAELQEREGAEAT
jgi:hypothetical protein